VFDLSNFCLVDPVLPQTVTFNRVHRFGQRRRDAEEFVRSFQDTFFMQRRRVMGDSIRILKCFGSRWQVSLLTALPHSHMRHTCNPPRGGVLCQVLWEQGAVSLPPLVPRVCW